MASTGAEPGERAVMSVAIDGGADPFDALARVQRDCWVWLELAAAAPGSARGTALLEIAERFVRLAREAPDALLGAVLLDDAAPYAQLHPLMVALIGELVGARAGIDEASRVVLVAAAMSCNLGMLNLQDELAQQAVALSDAQRLAIHEHPQRSHALLIAAGVSDPSWLAIVAQHHERPDGSGYPLGLRAPAVAQSARLIALADMYAAMVLPRGYRDGVRAQDALRAIFLARGSQVDGGLAALFINELGVFPPGIFVRLANGETGVVVKRGTRGQNPLLVSCFQSPRGAPYHAPILRQASARGELEVCEVLPRQRLPASPAALWGSMA